MTEEFEADRWYWDRRTRKALYPQRVDDTIEFITIWHSEEVTDALNGGALVPLEDVGLDETDTAFDLLESFRTPEHVTEDVAGVGSAINDDTDGSTKSSVTTGDTDDSDDATSDRERDD